MGHLTHDSFQNHPPGACSLASTSASSVTSWCSAAHVTPWSWEQYEKVLLGADSCESCACRTV